MNRGKNVRLPAHVTPEYYEIMLKPDLEGFIFDGEETITLNLGKATKEITLHSTELEIISAEVVHGKSLVWAGKVSYDEKAETATMIFPKTIQPGKVQLKLNFKGILNDKMRGFYRSKYSVDGVDKYMATTQFESTDARRAFPCFDEPAHKAIFDVTLMIPGNTVAISNTIESVVSEHESGFKLVKFLPTPKMSSYLLAFIVGEFEWVETPLRASSAEVASATKAEQDSAGQEEVKVRVFVTPGKKHQAEFALDVAVKCLDFYEKYFDIPYPLPVLDLIAIPNFAAGAMENWGAVTYRENAVLFDDKESSVSNKQRVALVIAHELAHQWFGNLVTMEWWTHLWLNEGFATYMEYLALDHIFPEWDIWTQFVLVDQGRALDLDSLKNTHPIEVEVHHPDEISEIFDAISYSKGASILKMLAEYLGAENFRDGLRHYLKKHSYGNAATEDLWSALEEVSGKPVIKIMKNWTSKPGYPVIRVQALGSEAQARRGVGSRVQLTQRRFFSSPISGKKSHDKTVWSIPIDGKLMESKNMVVDVNGKINLGEASFIRVNYPDGFIKVEGLSAVDRFGLIRDAFDLAEAGWHSTDQALTLAMDYRDEEDFTVWMEIASHLTQINSLIADEDFAEDFKKYGVEIFSGIAKKLGWEKKAGEKHTDTMLRTTALYNLGTYGDLETIKKAQMLFTRHAELVSASHGIPKRVRDDITLDPDLRGVVYNLVAENGSTKEFNSLVDMYKKADLHQEKDKIGRALSLFVDPKLLQKTLDFSVSDKVRTQDTVSIIMAVWANSKGRELAWQFFKKNYAMLKKRYGGGHVFPRLLQTIAEFTTVAKAKEVERFFKKNPTPEASRTIAQSLEKVYSNEAWLKRDKEKICDKISTWHLM